MIATVGRLPASLTRRETRGRAATVPGAGRRARCRAADRDELVIAELTEVGADEIAPLAPATICV